MREYDSLEIWFKRGHDLKIQRQNERDKKIKESSKIICSAPYRRLCFYKYKYNGVKYCRDKIGDCRYQFMPDGEQDKR
jgi:hypothetical protein